MFSHILEVTKLKFINNWGTKIDILSGVKIWQFLKKHMLNLLEFILWRLEKVGLRSKAGQAKVLGTILCICGSMLLSLYHGKVLIGQLRIHWKYSQHDTSKNIIDPNNNHGNFFLGPFLVIISTVVYSLWLIIQVRKYFWHLFQSLSYNK